MTLVVDASVAVKWLVREKDTEAARKLLRAPEPLIAPDWVVVEAASTFWKKVKRSELLAIHAERHLENLPEFFMDLHPAAEIVHNAFQLSIRLRHSPYDCLYLALALREDTELVTADEEFHQAILKAGLADRVRLLA
jgi:predicted nucleic acid-binding protein